jgi:outer membrane protein
MVKGLKAHRILILAAACLLLVNAGPGTCTAGNPLSLREAIKIAMEQNPEIRAMAHALSAQKEDIGIARSSFLPRLYLEERAVRTNNPPNVFMMKLNQERFSSSDFAIEKLNEPNPTNDFQTLFTLEQPLFVRRTQVGLTMAKQEYAAKREEYGRKREELALKIVQAYLRIHTGREYFKVAQNGLYDAKEHARIADVRYKADLGLYSDALRAKTAVTEAEQGLVRAERDLAVAKRWLGVLLGMTDTVETTEENGAIPLREADYYTKASASRRDLAALRIRQENARNNIKLAESLYFPSIGMRGSYQLNDHSSVLGSEGDSWLVAAFLRWDLFDGTNREYERKKALSKASEVDEYLTGLNQLISFKIHEASLAVEEARKNFELAKSALETAEEGKRLVTSRYEHALSPIVDLLDVQLSVGHARANVVARENEFQLAVINLAFESGTILKDLGLE